MDKPKPTSIRLPEELRVKIKTIAAKKGLSYQSYIRMILTEHITGKFK